MSTSRDEIILFHSNKLFIENGYDNTTMRQIATEAGVSLGLATYHFNSKRQIAVNIMARYLTYVKEALAPFISAEKDPLAHSAAMVHLAIDFFMAHPCKQFYLDCLKHDIYMEAIQNLGNDAMRNIMRAYNLGDSTDMVLLFDNYIPPSVEKILILEKEKGTFPNTSYDEVPVVVFSVSVDRYIGRDVIAKAAAQGEKAAHDALAQIPKDITAKMFA